MNNRWDKHFLQLCLDHARMSKDPSTKVGAVIVGPDREILSAGFNGFPRGIEDSPERLNNRDTKLELVVHGEMNAILAAARNGIRLKGSTMYLAATDASGKIWGGPPCVRCTVEAIQAGITEIVSWPFKTTPSRWADSITKAKAILTEAGVKFREVETSSDSENTNTDSLTHDGIPVHSFGIAKTNLQGIRLETKPRGHNSKD